MMTGALRAAKCSLAGTVQITPHSALCVGIARSSPLMNNARTETSNLGMGAQVHVKLKQDSTVHQQMHLFVPPFVETDF